MIIECPQCKTAHSKSEHDLADGAPVLCRRCGASFRPTENSGGPAPTLPLVPSAGFFAPSEFLPPADNGDAIELVSADDVSPADEEIASPPRLDKVPLPVTVKVPTPFAIDFGDLGNDAAVIKPAPLAIGLDTSPPLSSPLATAPDPVAVPLLVDDPAPAGRSNDRAPLPPAEALAGHAPAASGSGSSRPKKRQWSDAATDVIQSGVLKKRLEQMRVPDDDKAQHLGARGHVFPRDAWRHFRMELVGYLRAAPVRIKVIAGAIVAVPVALFVVVLLMALGSGRTIAYVSDAQALLSGPSAGEVYPQLAPVERGGRVEVVESSGEYSLVKDSAGRVGYLRSRSLRHDPPPAVPSQPFADCSRAPVDRSVERCQGRGQEQFEACRAFCNTDAEDPNCPEHCQKRFSECLAVCEQSDSPAASPVAPAGDANKAVRAADATATVQPKDAAVDSAKKKIKRPPKKKKGR